GRHPVADHAVVEVVVEALAGMVDLDTGQTHGEVVDHVVAAQLAVRDDVHAGDLLILDRGLDRQVVDLVQVMTADAPLEIVVLHALEPPGHRVAADDGGGEEWFTHRSASWWLSPAAWCRGSTCASLAGSGMARNGRRSPRARPPRAGARR